MPGRGVEHIGIFGSPFGGEDPALLAADIDGLRAGLIEGGEAADRAAAQGFRPFGLGEIELAGR